MANMNIGFIIGDSRLQGMQEYIDSIETQGMDIRVMQLSGKGFFKVTSQAMSQLQYYPFAKVIIAAGICDCTFKNKPNEKFRFTFNRPEEVINHLDELYKYSAKELTAYRPEAKISYSKLIGLDLAVSPYNAPPHARAARYIK